MTGTSYLAGHVIQGRRSKPSKNRTGLPTGTSDEHAGPFSRFGEAKDPARRLPALPASGIISGHATLHRRRSHGELKAILVKDRTHYTDKARVLFCAEAVTLAHVARPRSLAEGLDPARYDVHFAAGHAFDAALDGYQGRRWPLKSIPPERFLQFLSAGKPIYDARTLGEYVEEELALIDRIRPDLIVGDFRLSLAVSAPLRRIPYFSLTNAHWSPYAQLATWPVPDLPVVRALGSTIAAAGFNLARPLVFKIHARPLNRLRKRYGLPAVGDMRHAYTWGDQTLYLDVPELIPTSRLPANHRFIGPIVWEPPTAHPPWWNDLPENRPTIYLTLGSSGPAKMLPAIIGALADLPVTLLVATAGRFELGRLPPNVYAADYLPGQAAAARSSLVVCNGGSGTVYQSLSEGTPVIGIPSNLDQHLTMYYVMAAGAGSLLRSERLTAGALRLEVTKTMADPGVRTHAHQVANWFRSRSAIEGFKQIVREQVGS